MDKAVILRRDIKNINSIKFMIDYIFENLSDKSILKHDTILIKPNLMYYWDSSTGETTDPVIVKFIIEKLIDLFDGDVNIKIIESDASAMRTKYVFKVLGYDKLVSSNIELINLSQGENTTENININNKPIKVKINQILKRDHYLINVPKIKIHRNPPILSCALKNNFGLISTPYKYQYHKNLQDYILAINKIVKNDLVIVDGLVTLGKYPKKMGVIIGANNPLSCDILVSKVCGINIKKDQILSKFIANNYLSKKIEILDPDNVYNKICEDFPRVNPYTEKLIWDLQLFMLEMYIKLVGDIKPPILE